MKLFHREKAPVKTLEVPPAADTIESRFISINDLLQDLWLDAEMDSEMTPEQRKELNQAASLRRMCEMKKNGRLNVPEWVHQEFMKGGTARQVRDKYQKKIREYWVETGTEGTYQKEDEAALKEAWEAEGACGDEVTIGGPNPDEPLVAASAEEEDSESSEEEKPNRPKPRGGKPRGSGGKKSDLEEEAALE
ncbi:unnamed protein product, partial [Symbiodinium sp. KB8]